jgi:FkbM family methyltransferase
MSLMFRGGLTRLAHLYKALFRQHHRELLPAFAAVLDDQAVVIEAGGHAGQFTKLLAGHLSRGQVLTFEPGSYAFGILERVMRWRTGGRARAFKAALGREEGTVELLVPVKASGSVRFGLSHVAGRPGEAPADLPARREAVRQTTVDRVVAEENLQRVDLLKGDIEGWELQMLKGAVATLERFQPALFLEVDDHHLRRAGDSVAELWHFLEHFGYRGFLFDPATARFVPVEAPATGDLWFLPPALSKAVSAEAAD